MKVIDSNIAGDLLDRITNRESIVGIIGMGYVGLPLAVASFDAGFRIIGFDIDPSKISILNSGVSPIGRIGDNRIKEMIDKKRFEVTQEYDALAKCDIIIICVPTPLSKYREPDISYIVHTVENIANYLRRGQLISLESTTYPGTTKDVMQPILEKNGLKSGQDFFLAYSPEREDPGNPDFHTASIPKVVGGAGEDAARLAEAFYGSVIEKVVPVKSCEVAEAVKLTENIFRSVNIALVNELKTIYSEMGINIWEVIDAAKTKPFGFMPFYPGPGLGGHCIPIDPFYLAWKAREYNVPTRFIELAGEINTKAPYLVIDRLVGALSIQKKKPINGTKILMVGLAYKKNVEDTRESPAFVLMDLIEEKGGIVDYYDPFVPEIPTMREHMDKAGKKSLAFDTDLFHQYDAAVICTDHDDVDYAAIVACIDLIIDTRNVTRNIENRDNIVLA